jgi:phosphoglycolate phosphatase-like HAD superfamily hydrolase
MFVVIVDLDGTVADLKHRLGYIKVKPKNYDAFFAGVYNDEVHRDIIFLVQALHDAGATIILASGRPEKTRENTERWLVEKAGLDCWVKLYMRQDNDFRPDDIVKLELLEQMRKDGYDPVMAIDDRQRVVDMWRAAGLRCLQVAAHDF